MNNLTTPQAAWDKCQQKMREGKLTNQDRSELKRALGLTY